MSGWTWFLLGMMAQTLILTLWVGLVEIAAPIRKARREMEDSDA